MKKYSFINKADFAEGTWSYECDRIEFKHFGLHCLCLRREDSFAWAGYVGLHDDHSYYEVSYADISNIVVHGNLNFSGKNKDMFYFSQTTLAHAHDFYVSSTLWWLGFSCCSEYDYLPKNSLNKSSVTKYRNVSFIIWEVKRLAQQLYKLE